MVAKKQLEDIIPRYGLPSLLGSDNGLAFISQVTQTLVQILGTDWKLPCAYCSQSSGQVERMDWVLKETLTVGTGNDWVALIPDALCKARNTPFIWGLTPLKFLYGRSPPLLPNLQSELLAGYDHLEVLGVVPVLLRMPQQIWPSICHICESAPPPNPHCFESGDEVWI